MDGEMMTSGCMLFDTLRRSLSTDLLVRSEMEAALAKNLMSANPSDRGNRFIFGAGVEWIISSTCQVFGIDLVPAGHQSLAVDLVSKASLNPVGWSVKAQSSPKPSAFRISNGLGGAGKGLIVPTIFISPHLGGIVYVDPAVHHEVTACTVPTKDAIILPISAVRRHKSQHEECFIPLIVPVNEGTQSTDPYATYIKTLLNHDEFPLLSHIIDTM